MNIASNSLTFLFNLILLYCNAILHFLPQHLILK